jgi:anaerobic selenocysteine-containing dehydrogenase
LERTESWLYDSDESLIRTALNSGHPWVEGITFERLWETGFARLNHDRHWLPYALGFPTPTGKARLWSDSLAQRGLDPLPATGEIRSGRTGQLQLITGKTLFYLNSSYCNLERHVTREGTLYLEIAKHDANRRELEDNDLVEVFNDRGSVLARCRISERVRPGVVWMPFGGWGDAGGQLCSVNLLTSEEPTDWGGGSGFYDTFVDVRLHERPRPSTGSRESAVVS